MPQQAWSDKRERQYDHIKSNLERRGRSEDTAERIAAATVNQTRTASANQPLRGIFGPPGALSLMVPSSAHLRRAFS